MALVATPGLGTAKVRQLIRHFGSAKAVLGVHPDLLEPLPGIGEKLARAIAGAWDNAGWRRDKALAEERGVQVIPFTSPIYPAPLLEIPDPPIILYVWGELQPIDSQGIAIVGTRACSNYGLEMTSRFSRDLARAGFTIVSGLARGIDTEAHRAALETGRTVAVIGSGLNHLYPRENEALAEAIAKKGAVISEYPMATPPDRHHFPRRNRIVSGLTRGTLLIEAPLKSGALITMELAAIQGRHCFAIPGRCDSEAFRGNHHLIKKRQAMLVESAEEIAANYGELFASPRTSPKRPPLDAKEEKLLALLPEEELNIDEIALVAKQPIAEINVLLMSLLLKKCVKEYPGKLYRKTVSVQGCFL